MAPQGERDASTAAAIAELRTEMRYLRDDVKEIKGQVSSMMTEQQQRKGAVWAVRTIFGTAGAGILYGLQKLAIILPSVGK